VERDLKGKGLKTWAEATSAVTCKRRRISGSRFSPPKRDERQPETRLRSQATLTAEEKVKWRKREPNSPLGEQTNNDVSNPFVFVSTLLLYIMQMITQADLHMTSPTI